MFVPSDLQEPLLNNAAPAGRVSPLMPPVQRSVSVPARRLTPPKLSGSQHSAILGRRQFKKKTSRLAIFVPFPGAAAEASSYPHEPKCVHCETMLSPSEARWGSGLCNACYGKCKKECQECNNKLLLKQLHWNSGLCDNCYDTQRHARTSQSLPLAAGLNPGVRTAIGAQAIFYMAPAVMAPSLFLQVQDAAWSTEGGSDAASSYAAVLTTTTVVAMAAPIPFGIWAHTRGEREVYVGVTIAATIAALALTVAPGLTLWGLGLPLFAVSWGCLSAPLSLRGVRAAYFARHVAPSDLSRAGQIASAAGLAGSVAGPLLAALSRNEFMPAALCAAAAHAFAAVMLYAYLPAPSPFAANSGSKGGGDGGGANKEVAEALHHCEKCRTTLTDGERAWGTQLCNRCYDTWFKHLKRRALIGFCAVAGLLELSMNAAIVAPFQPIAVTTFGWGADQIAEVNLLSAAVSSAVSLAVAQLRLNEWAQIIGAAALYVTSTLLFSCPPLSEARIVVGLVLGLKAQILFMAPFTAAFSRLIGGRRVTNGLTTTLCLAPLIGAALGTACAPLLLPHAGAPLFAISALPAVIALLLLLAGWRRFKEEESRTDQGRTKQREAQPSNEQEQARSVAGRIAATERWSSNPASPRLSGQDSGRESPGSLPPEMSLDQACLDGSSSTTTSACDRL
jgi:hypothetical protein